MAIYCTLFHLHLFCEQSHDALLLSRTCSLCSLRHINTDKSSSMCFTSVFKPCMCAIQIRERNVHGGAPFVKMQHNFKKRSGF